MAIWITHSGFFPVPFILTRKNGGKRSPPIGKCSHVDDASSLLIPFLPLPLSCSSSPACSMWLCQQVLDDPNEDHLYMGKTALTFCHPCSGSCSCQSPGVLFKQPLPLASPTLSCSNWAPHRRLHPWFKAGGRKEFLLGLYLGVLFIHLQIFIEYLLCVGHHSRHEGCSDEYER